MAKDRISKMGVRKFDARFKKAKKPENLVVHSSNDPDSCIVAQGVNDSPFTLPESLKGRFLHIEMDLSNFLFVGDEVLMTIQHGVVVTAFVDEVVDGIVYATGDDGEPYCAPFGKCDKVSK